MLRRNLSDNTQASLNSAMIWSLLAILFIAAVVPASLYATNKIQDLSADESYFSPNKLEDFETPSNTFKRYTTNQNSYTDYIYRNDTNDSNTVTNSGLYTKNITGNDYHEYLFKQDPDDDGNFDYFSRFGIQLNQTTSDLIEDDMNAVDITAEFPRNASILFQIWMGDSSDGQYMLAEANRNVTTNMTKYSFNIDYSKILDADSTLEEDNAMTIVIKPDSEADNDALQPADSLKFNIDLIHSTSAMSTFWTVNVVSGLLGGFLMIGAVFSTPWVDLKDLTGTGRF